MRPNHGPRSPMFNDMPVVVLAVFGAIASVSFLIMIAPEEMSFRMANFLGVDERARAAPLARPWGYVLHAFVHGGLGHLAMNTMFGLILGRAVAKRLGGDRRAEMAFVAFFFACCLCGAVAQVWFDHAVGRQVGALVGASTGVSGLLAAAMYVLRAGYQRPLPSTWSAPYLTALAPWLALNLVPLGLMYAAPGLFSGLGGVAWMAHVGGLVAGALMFPIFDLWARGERRPPVRSV